MDECLRLALWVAMLLHGVRPGGQRPRVTALGNELQRGKPSSQHLASDACGDWGASAGREVEGYGLNSCRARFEMRALLGDSALNELARSFGAATPTEVRQFECLAMGTRNRRRASRRKLEPKHEPRRGTCYEGIVRDLPGDVRLWAARGAAWPHCHIFTTWQDMFIVSGLAGHMRWAPRDIASVCQSMRVLQVPTLN